MAPHSASLKRPAAASPQSVAKRPVMAQEATKGPARGAKAQCGAVAKAVAASADFPPQALEMLGACIPESLGVPKESRHAFQDEVVDMIGKVLAKQEEGLQAIVAEAGAKFDEVTGQKAERARAVEAAVQELSSREEAASAAQTAATEAASARVAAGEALAAADAELAASQAEAASVEARRALFASTLSDIYLPIKEGLAEPAKVREGLSAVVSTGKAFSMDQTLLDALPSAAGKAPGERGSFDALVLQQLDAEFQRCTAALEETIANAEITKKEREEKVVTAAAEVEIAKAAAQESKASLEAARAAQREALATKREAWKALQQWGPELKQTTAALDSAKASLEEFREGPLAAYEALLGYTLLAPKQAEPEAPAEAGGPVEEGAPAEAEAAPAE
eukprot:CAMPEP_0175437084 /NCGR_PEP_ID=MMETSP0095-20121207/55288_1 /TAXON_ID=311494 /ORGANISM="Alexandrium monilatum, Strain CCMP3105" /LENGTH=393 /DNA_ID=CAMNT_0016736747 /DNA_START=37 /DNA_END=1218 /DNA_ORIENTATION=+